MPRAELARSLFAEADSPRASLRWYLSNLRAALPTDIRDGRVLTGDAVGFTGVTDVRVFRAQLQTLRPAAVLDRVEAAGLRQLTRVTHPDLDPMGHPEHPRPAPGLCRDGGAELHPDGGQPGVREQRAQQLAACSAAQLDVPDGRDHATRSGSIPSSTPATAVSNAGTIAPALRAIAR